MHRPHLGSLPEPAPPTVGQSGEHHKVDHHRDACALSQRNRPYFPEPHHSPHLTNLSHVTPKSSTRTIIPEVPPVPNHPYRINVPPELRDSVHRTIGYALDFLLDMLDYSPEEPNNEADLRLVTTPANSVER